MTCPAAILCYSSRWRKEGRKEMFYLPTHSTHFIYCYMASDMVKDHSDSEKGNPLPPHMVKDHSDSEKETHCRHIGYSLLLTARVLLYAPSHRQDSTYHSLCYTSRGALPGTKNSSVGPQWRIDPTTHHTMSERSYHGGTSRYPVGDGVHWSVV